MAKYGQKRINATKYGRVKVEQTVAYLAAELIMQLHVFQSYTPIVYINIVDIVFPD